MNSTLWEIATVVLNMDRCWKKKWHFNYFWNKTVGSCPIRNHWTSTIDNQRKPTCRGNYRLVLQTYRSNSGTSAYNHKCGIYIPSWLDYLIWYPNVYMNRQPHAVHQKVLRNAVNVSRHKEIDNNRLQPTKKWALYDTTKTFWAHWALCCWSSAGPERTCSIVFNLFIQYKSTLVYQRLTFKSYPVTQPFWASAIRR